MSLITVRDIQNALPTVGIGPNTKPTEAQVQGFINAVEGELRGLLASCFAPWPTDPDSVPFTFIRDTIIEGAKNLTLRSKYAMTAASVRPAEISDSRDAYMARIRVVCDVAKALRENTPETAGSFIPVVGAPQYAAGMAGSFTEYTQARNWVESERYRSGNLPWPL